MIVKFPDLDTLRLALTSGAIPADVSQKPAVAGFGEQDQLWVETSAKLSAAAQKELKRLGALVCKASGATLSTEVSCWLELLPLVPEPASPNTLEQTPVLFDVHGGEELSRLVLEMLRLGNDRQSVRWLEEIGARNGDGCRALLRVVGPPYYSLLRALDQLGGPSIAPRAFVERAAGVWVELGHAHPLAAGIRPPKDHILLLRSPRQWTLLPDAPFHDVYEIVEFQLPDGGARWQDSSLPIRLRVAPRLRQAGPTDGAELWVLRGQAIDELNRFVQNAEDQLLARLAFAVAEKNGQTLVVLRVRQSRLPPPVVVLPAEAYKSYLKLSNLFLPAGSILHPPLRRDVVRKLLAEDVAQITWLAPGENGAFTPESLPEDVFRPLTDWVDYVLDRDKELLHAWMQATLFEFEPFLCNEDAPPKPKKPPAEKTRGQKAASRAEAKGAAEDRTAFEALAEAPAVADEETALEAFAAVAKVEPSEVQKELAAVEEEFLALAGTLEDEAHQSLWPRLAQLNGQLLKTEDAGICWLNALWEARESPDSAVVKWTAAWFRTEAIGAAQHYAAGPRAKYSWIARAAAVEGARRDITDEDLDILLKLDEPATADIRALAAYLVWSARRTPCPAPLMQRLQRVQRFLEKREQSLPVRACWLAWYHLVQLLDGDVLALARARDRLLERLFHNGLRPEQDLPSFLRFAGQPTSQRNHDVRAWMKGLCEKARDWIEDNRDPVMKEPPTKAYSDLLFAFALARLGESDAAKQLLKGARESLRESHAVHAFLLKAFEVRIQEALEGKPHTGSLPPALMGELEQMIMLDRYVVERMRHNSRILEPEQQVNPYRHWEARMSDLDRALIELVDGADRKEIPPRIHKLLQECPKGPAGHEARAKVLRTALEIAPHLGEDFAREMLDRTLPAFDALPEPSDHEALRQQAKFVEKALFTAAHFGRAEHISPLVGRFRKLIHTRRGPQAIEAVCTLAEQCFRSLRKLGMREEIDRLLGQMADLVLQGKDIGALVRSLNFKQDTPAPLIALLQVAASWYYFGRDDQADTILQTVREVVFKADFAQPRQRRDLVCAYTRTVGQAPPEVAKNRLEEIFSRLKGYRDTFTTSSHFSVIQLDVIESVVLAVVSEDFTQGAQARRWLDEEEYLVRRRIHKDVRHQMTHA